jgi:hypothetical protein
VIAVRVIDGDLRGPEVDGDVVTITTRRPRR